MLKKIFALVFVFSFSLGSAFSELFDDESYIDFYMQTADFKLERYKTYNMDNDLDTAIEYYKKACELSFGNIDATLGLGMSYLYAGRMKDAKKTFLIAINQAPTSPNVNFCLGEYYFKQKEYIRALKYYIRAEENGYNEDFETNYQIGIIYEKLGDVQNAKKYYLKCTHLNGKNSELYSRLERLK